MLSALQQVPFEIAVGRNGAFWVNAGGDHRTTVAVVNILLNSEELHGKQEITHMARAVLAAATGGGGKKRKGTAERLSMSASS